MRVTAVPILPSRRIVPDTRKQKRAIENALDGTAKAIRVDYNVTTRTWANKPQFVIEIGKWWERLIYTTSDIYRYISRGTAVRYATMTPDFEAKTAPRIVASRTGAGGVMFVRKDRPKPGIKAREFEEVISDKWRREWPRNLARSLAAEF